VEKAIAKAAALVEADEYIRKFRDKIVVVKLGGSVLDDENLQREILTDISFMSTVGMRVVIVHGGGKAISSAMDKAGLETVWVKGRRYTDHHVLTIAENTLVKQVNEPVCNTLNEMGTNAMGLHTLSSCVLFAKTLRLQGENGRKLDVGYVGSVESVNSKLVDTLCKAGVVPVIAPVAQGISGGKLNVNADSAAGMVAASLEAEKLVVVSDTHGIRSDINDPDSWISSLDEEQIQKMIDEGVITDAMFPKVDACLKALNAGVQKAHIIDGRIDHSLLLEIYTDMGIGTEILK
jgi:acetylglutamate kinase